MTSDLEATTDDLYNSIRDLWHQAQGVTSDNLAPPAGFGQAVTSVPDEDIAEVTGLDLEAVREYLDHADGVKFIVGRDGDTRRVTALT